jgi:hypothetical protein
MTSTRPTPRPRIGSPSPLLHCSCGARFSAPTLGIQIVGDGGPDVALTNCPECHTTRGWECEPESALPSLAAVLAMLDSVCAGRGEGVAL